MSYLKKGLDGLWHAISDLVDKQVVLRRPCKMKKAFMIIFIIILVGHCNGNAESQNQVVFYNEDSYYVKLYPSPSACINDEATDYFVFNGYCDQVTSTNEDEGIAVLNILGNTYYVRTKDLSMNTQNIVVANSFLEAYLEKSNPFVQCDGTQKTIPPESSVLILGYIDQYVFLVDYLGCIGSTPRFPINYIKPGTTCWLLPMSEAVSIAFGALQEKYGRIDSEYDHIYTYCFIIPNNPNASLWYVYFHRNVRMENEAYIIEINAIDGGVIQCEYYDDLAG